MFFSLLLLCIFLTHFAITKLPVVISVELRVSVFILFLSAILFVPAQFFCSCQSICTQFHHFALNFIFWTREIALFTDLGLIDMFSTNQNAEIVAFILWK